MAKRLHEDGRRWRLLLIPLAVCCSCMVASLCISPFLQNSFVSSYSSATKLADQRIFLKKEGGDGEGCCRGVEHTELWSDAVNWGSDFLLNSTQECCDACKANRKCNSWVYCADPAKCGSFYRQARCGKEACIDFLGCCHMDWTTCVARKGLSDESDFRTLLQSETVAPQVVIFLGENFNFNLFMCWLKRQKDPLNPDVHDSGSSNPWTSGLQFDEDIGIVGLAIDSGTMKGQVIHMKLLPDCSPQSVMHILELAQLTHCQGCRFYRAEGRGKMWDSSGSHISKMSTGPPYAVLQGTLEAQHVSFRRISREYSPVIRRGMVGWVDGGPDFFISLADHYEWPRKHTVFATVVQGDMHLVEKLAELPTTTSSWEKVAVEVLETPVDVKVQRPAMV